MSGYRCFMRSVKLNFLLMFFLILGLSYQGYADCPNFVTSNTWFEAIVSGDWVKEIKVQAIKDQGVDGYFNPKIRVCAYDGKSYCYDLQSGESCRQIYGTQSTGGGVSAAAFIDWGGDKMLNGGKIHGQVTRGLEWEWADGVTDEEKRRFANSPKICACSQKGACISGISACGSRVFSGENIFRPGEMENVCDTCYQEKVKCAPVPLAPGPPPFCEQLAMSPPQVRIVPITDEDNDYFNPKVKVIIGDLKGGDGEIGEKLDFPKGYGEDKAEWRSILDKDGITYYFKTYREKDKLCAEYLGTQSIDEKNPQFVRCFPAPPTPEPEVVEIVKSNTPGKQSNTLKIRMKMSENTCTYEARGTYSNGLCTFNVNAGSSTNIGPLSLKVVKPRIVKKTTDSNNEKSYIDNIIEGILESNPQQFKVLKEYDYVPDIETECKEFQGNKCKLNSLGQPEVEIKYKENSNSRMLCLSGWQPEPEEFVLERENKIIPLKLMGTKYIKYNAVYSKESNRFYYLPSKERETVDLLKIKRLQDQLDKIIFNKQGYVFFPDDNKQEKGKCSYCVKRNDEIDKAFKSGKGLKVVYKLTDVEHREKCNQGDDGCICSDGKCSRSKQYLNKNENDKPFYLRYEEVDCKDKDGKVLRDEKNEVQKCTQLKDQLIKADRTEVFYADKLCRFDLEGLKKKLKEKLKEIIKEQLKNKKPDLEKNNEKSYDHENKDVYTDDLSIKFDRVEIEAWGSGEAGHIKDTPINCESSVCSTESRAGMPGDYIKAKLKIDPNYPVIKVKVTEGGGNQENNSSDKDGGPIFIKMCRSDKQDCKPLITVAGGGMYRTYGPERTSYRDTIIHEPSLELEKTVIPASALKFTEDNKITYIEDGQVKYEIIECGSGLRSSKPGAGGCIYKSKEIYGKGSPGYVKIRPIIKEFDKEEINDAIEKVTRDLYDLEAMTDFSTKDLNVNIREKVEEEIKKELLR
ncbi:hypothetical protein NMD99_04475 [Wolbachia endosymbiont of Listronotus oregonensis]|uniref:hypothetical protein n=1 Tax=Wolbachia endosymbiont of Listronotus oregonensis TaxID=2969106 RepID=UPI0028158A4E|nr:hypothetical protein [Wolbachia endosymbiont of Listronotus oregonensis]WMT83931.1 hypothetical protein NMD99_04475 [Wolbachia endosymbiont of Listronotus oregonensis]